MQPALRLLRSQILFIAALAAFGASAAPGGRLISDDNAKAPPEELKTMHVPPGFEVQLVASDPDIHKPLNINFDARGRLWVTDTIEYPFPAQDGKPTRDTVKILDDFDAAGHARKITTFADNLNIPVGVLPVGDNAAIVYSIPGIWKLTDTKGTGHADQRDLLLNGFAHDDTHGMTGSFNEGFDGQIYAVHGFRNTSQVKGSDGSSIIMNSGNTYRFKRDGSHIEYFTHGQVNPFGMCFDSLGNLYTSDCETMPIALLLRGSYHPSFGKPDDGLGFSPEMCEHMYGSSAIAGLCDYVADQYPPEFRNRMLVGNVMTGRINNAHLAPRGSAFHADDEPDFLTCDDTWFRPVCIKLGPDGAIYVADFYNRIIGHYEVDLHHPGRDKQRGRIWRIVYKGPGAPPAPAKKFDLTQATLAEVIESLASPNLTIRMLATHRLADTLGQPAVAPLKEMLAVTKDPFQKAHGLWVLFRLNALEPALLQTAAADADPIVRQHAMRVLGELQPWQPAHRELALAGLKDADPLVRRPAAEALGRHPEFDNLRPLLEARQRPDNDPYLTHTLRIALRDQLQDDRIAKPLLAETWSVADEHTLADAAAGATSPGAAGLLLRYVRTAQEPKATVLRYLHAIVTAVPEDQVEELAKFIAARFGDDTELQLASLMSVLDGLSQRGIAPGEAVRSWGRSLAAQILPEVTANAPLWTYRPIDGSTDARNPWGVQSRASADGVPSASFLSSIVRGETLTGVARSPVFKIPPQLSFYIAGHNGLPPQISPAKNIVRLREAGTDKILAEQIPPRNDVAQKVTWDLNPYAGRQGYIEATDGDDATAFAWMAFGRFDPPVVNVGASGSRLTGAIQIIASLHLTDRAGAVVSLLSSRAMDDETRIAAARALGSLDPSAHLAPLAAVLRDPAAHKLVRDACANALGLVGSAESSAALLQVLLVAPHRTQLELAKALASTPAGAQSLLDSIRDGKASARLLQDINLYERLTVARIANLDARIAELTKGLPAADAEIQRRIDQQAAAFNPAKASPDRGKLVFQKNCIACHMIGIQGAHVGPQLDGIGARGVPRLCEDILDPSRNVDIAFRYTTYVMTDGNVQDGILRRQEGQTLTLADSTGKEVTIDTSKIKRKIESKLSLMPGNFGEIIPEQEFNDLLSYLLAAKVE